ncbi:MAG: hypothetical protein PHH77_04845 [Victivallaceae bacterium]|nr:hypothetical protein [Victivallaceae bacterium]
MKTLVTMLIAVIGIGLYAEQAKEQQLNKQIAILESKIFALETENKKLKTELDKKDKAINALAIRLATRPAVNKSNSGKYDYAEAQRKAAELQKKQQCEQQEQSRKNNLKIIQEKIKLYQFRKEEKNTLSSHNLFKLTIG